MTAPQRTPMASPGEFPEADLLLASILAAEITADEQLLGEGRFDTDVSGLEVPCGQVYVPPGRRALNAYGDVDSSFVYVGMWGETYDHAVELQRQVRRILTGWRDGGLWRGVQVHRVREVSGPAAIPRDPDAPDELVESGWTVLLRQHRGGVVLS